MNDRQLKSFMTIVEKKSFTSAADALFITQSALSQQIRQLEHQIGFALFDRSTRKVTLTEAGRSFYQTTLKVHSLMFQGIAEGQQLQRLKELNAQRLYVACLGDQFYQIWTDLNLIVQPLKDRYLPAAVRYESKEALYAALLQGEAHIAAMLENEDIARLGLNFMPFARVPELCLLTYQYSEAGQLAELPDGTMIHLEDLNGYLIAFHNHPNSNLYEDRLRAHLDRNLPQHEFVDPEGFFTASYRHTVLLLPAIQYSGHAKSLPLDWEGGATLGFVTAPNAGPKVLEYARYIKEHLQPIPNYWEPIRD